MRPTNPTTAQPVAAAPAPAADKPVEVLEPATKAVFGEKVVKAAPATARVVGGTSVPRPIVPVMTKRAVVEAAIVVEPDSFKDVVEEEVLSIGIGAREHSNTDADGFRPYDTFAAPNDPNSYGQVYLIGRNVPGRGIGSADRWLEPFDKNPNTIEAERLEAEANQRRLEFEHDRLPAEGKMEKRFPMKRGKRCPSRIGMKSAALISSMPSSNSSFV